VIATLLALALAAATGPSGPVLLTPLDKSVNPVVTKVREKQEYIEKLKRDIFKVDKSIAETDKLIAKAIEIITSGRRVPAPEALRSGMVDAVVTNNLRAAAVRHAQQLAGRKRRLGGLPLPSETTQDVENAASNALARGKGRAAPLEQCAGTT
jgi:hypothetical protein